MPKSWVKEKLIESGIPARGLKGLARQLSEVDSQLDNLRSRLGKKSVEHFFSESMIKGVFDSDNHLDNLVYATEMLRDMYRIDESLPHNLFKKDPCSRLTFLNVVICSYHGLVTLSEVVELIKTPEGLELIKNNTKDGGDMNPDCFREGLKSIRELRELRESHTLNGLLAKHGNLKGLVHKRDRDTIGYLENLGINYDPFSNLSDPRVVTSAVTRLKEEKSDSFYGVVVSILKQKGLQLDTLSGEDVRVYSDEIALGIEESLKKRPSAVKNFEDLENHIKSAFSRGDVSFRYSTRSDEDRKLGDKCGDCTAQGGLNADKVNSWLTDSLYQQMSLFYGSKFVGRMNLAIVEGSGKPMVLIDAIEFVPQARETYGYDEMAEIALKEGIEKVKQIADSMGIERVSAYTSSNSDSLDMVLGEIGYNSTEKQTVRSLRQKSTQKALGVEDKIPYFLQAMERTGGGFRRSRVDHEKMHGFEKALDEGMLQDKAKKDQLVDLIRKGDLDTAASAVWQYDLVVGNSSIYRHLGMNQEAIARGLRELYGETSLRDSAGVKLTTIRKEKN